MRKVFSYDKNTRGERAIPPPRPTESYGNPDPTEGPWPECVGQTGQWCTDYIAGWIGYGAPLLQVERPFQIVNIIPPFDYIPDRVWIHVDDNNVVLTAPQVG